MNLKFSSYLTDIENKNRIRKYKKLELINVSKSSIEKEFNTTFRQMEVLGRIGGGTKTHRITINAAPTPDGWIVWNAYSYCGSQKWTPYGHSQIFAFESNDMSKVTCDKCLGIRVKGGKAPPPKSTRPKIDPMLRPRSFNFEYKESHPLVSNRVTHESYKNVREDSAKGLTAEIAKKKIMKFHTRFWNEMTENHPGYVMEDWQILAVSAWNGERMWSKNNGWTPKFEYLKDTPNFFD